MWNVQAFLSTLPIMAKGMGGIFAVTIVLILVIALLNRATRTADHNKNGRR